MNNSNNEEEILSSDLMDPANMNEEQLEAYFARHEFDVEQLEQEESENKYDSQLDEENEDLEEEVREEESKIASLNENQYDLQKQDIQYESSSQSLQIKQNESFADKELETIRIDIIKNINRQRLKKSLNFFNLELMTNNIAQQYAEVLAKEPYEQSHFAQMFHNLNNSLDWKYIKTQGKYNQFIQQPNSKKEQQPINNLHMIILLKWVIYSLRQIQIVKFCLVYMAQLYKIQQTPYKIVQVLVQQKIRSKQPLSQLFHKRKQLLIKSNLIMTIVIKSFTYVCLEITVLGKMLDDKVGIYALRVLYRDQNMNNPKNDLYKIGPDKINFDKKTKEFTALLEAPSDQEEKIIEFYVRTSPDSILYGKQLKDKLMLKHLNLTLRVPALGFFTNNYNLNDVEICIDVKIPNSIVGDPEIQSQSQRSDDINQQIEVKPQVVQKMEISKEQEISNRLIKEELEMAISEAQRQHNELFDHNSDLQSKVKMIKLSSGNKYGDQQSEMAMNEHKYLNTLAHVHQIRLDLKQTQDRYNKMAYELQVKLEEKQKKCNEIKLTFMELKREVARKAVMSRTEKTIPEKQIDEWEERELDKNKLVTIIYLIQKLQELRLDILRLRNTLTKNQKILKKKEELAEGLHLIDFEQLKIENQTLNEKIEERNEDLHKLKSKTSKTVEMLTHIKEKRKFDSQQFEKFGIINSTRSFNICLRIKFKLTKLTKGIIRSIQKRKGQDSEWKYQIIAANRYRIVNSYELISDFHTRKLRLDKLKVERGLLEKKLLHMQRIIAQYDLLQNRSKAKQ